MLSEQRTEREGEKKWKSYSPD